VGQAQVGLLLGLCEWNGFDWDCPGFATHTTVNWESVDDGAAVWIMTVQIMTVRISPWYLVSRYNVIHYIQLSIVLKRPDRV